MLEHRVARQARPAQAHASRHPGRLPLLLLLGALAVPGCHSTAPSSPSDPVTTPISGTSAVLVGAGDIADCTRPAVSDTASLLDSNWGTVFTLGDNVYDTGTMAAYTSCYGPNWGRQLQRTRPSPGNHDYDGVSLAAYLAYFGSTGAAGATGEAYYSYEAGNWHVVSLNSVIPIGAGSAQLQWLQEDLAASKATCTIAYWHHPLFSSAQNGPQAFVKDLWRVLYQNNVDIVMNGHDHVYERFGPQDPDGRADVARGIRQFTVGTGGSALYVFEAIRANSQAHSATHGVLRLDLQANSYAWQFIPVAGQTFSDTGSGSCH
jgi:acid phosphatase type 7